MANFDQIGGFDLLLPFMLVFTIVFAVLEKIKLFGSKSKNINAIVSLVVSIFFLNNTYLIFVLQGFLPSVAIILIVFLMFLLVFGVFSGEGDFQGKALGWAFVASLIAIGFALFSDIFTPGLPGGSAISQFYRANTFLIWLLVLAAVFIMSVMKSDKTNRGSFFQDIADSFERKNK
ncbi:MAG: hypothetical protein Q8Q42_04520 [Nanoarchaeota archaeon]|nr:hypothetical protein [Nanoarchaeota archaeon]